LHLSCIKISTISNELSQASTWASSPRSTIGCVQNDFWAYGMFSTNLHISWTDNSTISKWTNIRFHMTHVTLQFHRVRPKWFLRLWYVRHKPCTYHASSLAIFLNGLDRACTWASSHRSTIGCVQIDFWACGTFGANRAPICIKISTISKQTESSIHLSLNT
jgi:hypothetical protein